MQPRVTFEVLSDGTLLLDYQAIEESPILVRQYGLNGGGPWRYSATWDGYVLPPEQGEIDA